MPVSEPYWIDTRTAGRLAILPRPRGGDWLEDEVRAWTRANLNVVVSLLTPDEDGVFDLAGEGRLARDSDIQFISFPIPDRGLPESRQEAAELVAALADAVAAGKNVGIHCRQGIGRSAVLAAAVLIALGVEAEVALSRVATARGLPVPETPEQRRWVTDFGQSFDHS